MRGDDVAQLSGLSRDELVSLWQAQKSQPPPRKISRQLLRRILAYDMQTTRQGGLSKRSAAKLRKLAAGDAAPAASSLTEGTRLLRNWNGKTHLVEVIGGNITYEGETYRSLSAVAKTITGAHWSGPRFFGLNRKQGGAT